MRVRAPASTARSPPTRPAIPPPTTITAQGSSAAWDATRGQGATRGIAATTSLPGRWRRLCSGSPRRFTSNRRLRSVGPKQLDGVVVELRVHELIGRQGLGNGAPLD